MHKKMCLILLFFYFIKFLAINKKSISSKFSVMKQIAQSYFFISIMNSSKTSSFCKPYSHYSSHSQQNDKALVLARCNTNQFSRCFAYSTAQLWNSLPNEAVLAIKQDRFKVLIRKFLTVDDGGQK